MARENSFIFFGRSVNAPVAFFNEDSKTYRLTFTVETFRRNGRKDYPTINVYSLNEGEAKEYVSRMHDPVFIEVRGMASTKMVKKPVKCEACGNVNFVDTLQTEIISYGKPFILKEKVEPTDIVEFANVGNLIGSLCTDITRKDIVNGKTAAQFQIAVNRRFRVNELERGTRTDYPWVKVFGDTADECLKRLKKSSQIYITGAFQTRDIERRIVCSKCDEKLSYSERVGEIVPNGIEFLNNCLFDKPDAEEKANEKA